MSKDSSPVTVRDATIEDADVIADFNIKMAVETEDYVLEPAVIGAGVRKGMARPDLCRYFVAEVDGRVVGTCMITYELSDWRNGLLWWIQSVYVDKEYRGRGIFRALYHYVERLATEDPEVHGLRLYVMENNHTAMRTYEAMGMSEMPYRVYKTDSPDV